jgi:hypothetical protein
LSPEKTLKSFEKVISKDDVMQDNSKAKASNRKDSVDNITNKNSTENIGRKKSIGSSFSGLLGTSNVKNLQKEFMHKASKGILNKTEITKVKSPSKLVSPKFLNKESPPTFANKLTKLITPSSNLNKTSLQTPDKSINAESIQETSRDYSKDSVPKKKYLEHCFSDEYSTTTDDEGDDQISEQKNRLIAFKKLPTPNESDDETSDVSKHRTFFVLPLKEIYI